MLIKVINNADSIIFSATGTDKAKVIERIFKKGSEAENFPASYITPYRGEALWLFDAEAAKIIG